jgi:hypothetical protein
MKNNEGKEWITAIQAMDPEGNLTLEKLMEAYKLVPPPIDVWGELAKKYNMHQALGDLLVISTNDESTIIEWGLEIPTWVKFSQWVKKGEMIVIRASAVFRY